MKRTIRMGAGYMTTDTDVLEAVKKDFAENGNARVHVGILGGFAGRVADDEQHEITNPELGAIHEFGAIVRGDDGKEIHIPARSFLRMPVITVLPDALLKTDRGLWEKLIIKKGIRGALGILGAYALDTIHLAFETGGFGSWPALSPITIRRRRKKGRNGVAILIDTAQMRQAITAEVFDK